MESQPQNPEFRINPENFTHDLLSYSHEKTQLPFSYFFLDTLVIVLLMISIIMYREHF